MKGDRVGPYTLGAASGQWGGGFYVARDDAGKRVVVQRAFDREAPALAREAAWRRVHPHANMPLHVADGPDSPNTHWIAYAAVAAVRVEHAIGVHPVPVVLSWARELVDVMSHHARSPSQSALRPVFSDLLLTSSGALLVLTAPSIARTWQSDLLRNSRLDFSMRERGDARGTASDVFAVGGFLQEMLREKADEPRRDISARTALLVQRAVGPLEGRHESLDELAHDVRTSLDEFPPLDPADRERAVRAVAGEAMADVEKELRE